MLDWFGKGIGIAFPQGLMGFGKGMDIAFPQGFIGTRNKIERSFCNGSMLGWGHEIPDS